MCCEADWKREIVPDHKFDFINVREFHRDDFMTRLKYVWKYILILKNVAVYGFDIFTAATYILSDHWTNAIQRKCGDNCAVEVKFSIAKWVFVGCIIFSFLLLGYETWKAQKVVKSRDISYAFTNLQANDYYSLKNYDNFCLFCHISNSTKRADDFAFFVYFAFKEWKRLLLADGPRQSINALTLYSFGYANGWTTDISAYFDGSVITAMLLFSIVATVLIFAGSLILLIAAAICYIPLLCYIQGNLKEYVCHKVDKRIAELIKKKQRERIKRNAALEKKLAGKPGSVKDMPAGSIPQPTLPDVRLNDDDVAGLKIQPSRSSTRKSDKQYAEYEVYGARSAGYPPAPDYKPPYDRGYDEYGSSTNLASMAAPLGISYPPLPPPSSQHIPYPPNTPHGLYSNSNPSFSSSRSLNNPRPPVRLDSYDSFNGPQKYDRPYSPNQMAVQPRYDAPDGLPYDEPLDTARYGYDQRPAYTSRNQSQNPQGQGRNPGHGPAAGRWDYR